MVVKRDREHLLGMVLADHVVVKNLADLFRRRSTVARLRQRGPFLLGNDIRTQVNALGADEHGRPGDELAHLVLALAAKRAVECVLRIAAAADLAHLGASTRSLALVLLHKINRIFGVFQCSIGRALQRCHLHMEWIRLAAEYTKTQPITNKITQTR